MLQAHLFDRRADVLVGDLRIDLLGGKDEALSDVARGKWLNRSGNQGWVRIEVRDQHTVVRQCRRKEYAMLCLDEACHSGHRGTGRDNGDLAVREDDAGQRDHVTDRVVAEVHRVRFVLSQYDSKLVRLAVH